MTVLCDWQIKQLSRPFGGPQYSDVSYHHVVEPFVDHQVREDEQGRRLISYGLSSFGYDVRLAPRLLLVDPGAWDATCLDPKDPDGRNALVFSTEILPDENGRMWMPPHSFALGCTVERFDLPTNVMGVCLGKSTYARNGIIPHVTPLEPGWQGYLTLEFSNNTPVPVCLYANEGVVQIVFHEGEEPSVTYADRAGKYQDQPADIVFSKV